MEIGGASVGATMIGRDQDEDNLIEVSTKEEVTIVTGALSVEGNHSQDMIMMTGTVVITLHLQSTATTSETRCSRRGR